MVKFSPEQMRAAMGQQKNVRNMAVIAHVDHGKTTLTDSLLSAAGILADHQAGSKRGTDTRADEQLRGITIKSTAVSLFYDLAEADVSGAAAGDHGDQAAAAAPSSGVLVNLIDSPGHVDFSSEVTAALRVSDGAMVVVDCVNGVCVQTGTVLRQALAERVRPILMMNKLDRCILEKQMEPEDIYQHLHGIIARVNSIVQTYQGGGDVMGDLTLDPARGNVGVGSGKHGWGFTLGLMAQVYADRLQVDKEKLQRRLWGDHFYNPETRKWSRSPGDGGVRGFCQFVLQPITRLLRGCLQDDPDLGLVERTGVKLSAQEKELRGKDLMCAAMRKWLPAGRAMLTMIAQHLPSPVEAQQYRTELLYEGPHDDEVSQAMRACDPAGPLMMYVSKMVPASDKGRFYAFGRVFSGTVASGQKVRIMGPDYVPGTKKDLFVQNIPRTVVMMTSSVMAVDDVPCGNVAGLVGIEKCLLKTGTVTNYEDAHNMRVLRFSVSPVVCMAVEVVSAADLPKLKTGLDRLAHSDPLIKISMENKQHLVAGAGELHLEICFNDLQEYAGVPIKRSDPVVSYKETVSDESSQVVLAKSGNKHNRLYMRASPLSAELMSDIDDGEISAGQDPKERARLLADRHGWDPAHARKVWAFGPHTQGPCLLVDCCHGVQGLNDIRDAVLAGFQWATEEGVLCEENCRGIRLDLVDAKVHSDPACRKGGQIIPMARRAIMAAILTAKPRMMEPVYKVDIQTAVGGVYGTLMQRRGRMLTEEQVPNTPLVNITATLPVREAFGFTEVLRGATGGEAFPQCVFDHWAAMPGEPAQPDSAGGQVVAEVRARKKLTPGVPDLTNFLDKL